MYLLVWRYNYFLATEKDPPPQCFFLQYLFLEVFFEYLFFNNIKKIFRCFYFFSSPWTHFFCVYFHVDGIKIIHNIFVYLFLIKFIKSHFYFFCGGVVIHTEQRDEKFFFWYGS